MVGHRAGLGEAGLLVPGRAQRRLARVGSGRRPGSCGSPRRRPCGRRAPRATPAPTASTVPDHSWPGRERDSGRTPRAGCPGRPRGRCRRSPTACDPHQRPRRARARRADRWPGLDRARCSPRRARRRPPRGVPAHFAVALRASRCSQPSAHRSKRACCCGNSAAASTSSSTPRPGRVRTARSSRSRVDLRRALDDLLDLRVREVVEVLQDLEVRGADSRLGARRRSAPGRRRCAGRPACSGSRRSRPACGSPGCRRCGRRPAG